MNDYGQGYETPAHAESARNYCRICAVEASRGGGSEGRGYVGGHLKKKALERCVDVRCGRQTDWSGWGTGCPADNVQNTK